MLSIRGIDFIWVLLMGITIGNYFIAENGESNLSFIVLIAVSLMLKGRLVVDRFMELKNANQKIRGWMNAYFYVVPLMIILVYAYPEVIVQLTQLKNYR